MQLECHVAIAGWSIRSEQRDLFPSDGSHLQRYASRFRAVEINSSFYKPHKRETYEKWAASVPAAFRFSVKMPKALTHEGRLLDTGDPLKRFLSEIRGLGGKLGCVLVQLPPSLAYEPRLVESFFTALRARYRGLLVCEPRHPTWFTGAADARLDAHGVARVAADPCCAEGADMPAGSTRVAYFRLHGSPVMYQSSYDTAYLERLAMQIRELGADRQVWCVFDNTSRGAATANAIELRDRLVGGEDGLRHMM
ncbi:MAG TPA: DUF72 domain-containing protein [Vicinamibacterales bacterium]|nr:DUF72 domain-containing protein [Vicinamibacterales bacterium]